VIAIAVDAVVAVAAAAAVVVVVIVGSAAVDDDDPGVTQGILDDQRLEWMVMTTMTTTSPW